jgi:hypothetical protein
MTKVGAPLHGARFGKGKRFLLSRLGKNNTG